MNIHLPQIRFPVEIAEYLGTKFEEQQKTKISSGMHRAQIDREKINLHKILRALESIETLNDSGNIHDYLDNLEKSYNTLANTCDSFDDYLDKLTKGNFTLKDAKFSTRVEVLKGELEANKVSVKKVNQLATSVFQRLRDAAASFILPQHKSEFTFHPASFSKKRVDQESLRGGCALPCQVAGSFSLGGSFLELGGGSAQAESALFFEGRLTPDSARLLEGRETPDTARLTCRKEMLAQGEVPSVDLFPLERNLPFLTSLEKTVLKKGKEDGGSGSRER
jgi:hypothetical protein